MLKRVIVLDDDKATLDTLHEVLNYLGYEVLTTDQTSGIFNLIRDFKPDAILLEYQLQGVNGGDICNKIKSNPATMHLPVIMMSGYARAVQFLELYRCDSFIAKPFSLSDLTDSINYNICRCTNMVNWSHWAQNKYAC